MDLRARRLAVGLAFHAGVLALGVGLAFLGSNLGVQALFDAGGLLVLFHILSFQRLPLVRLVQQRLIRRQSCILCGLEINLHGPWKCGCGFISSGRHCYSPCPQCGKGYAWIVCPRCGTGILI